MSHQLVNHWQSKATITQLCDLLDISRAGYYAAKSRSKAAQVCATSTHLQAAFNATGKCYGSRRLVAALRAKSIHIGRYKARRIMRELNIKPIWKRKFVNTTDSKHNLPVADNLLNREFNPSAPNRAWTSDITYIRTRTGWLYLAVVMDLYSRRIIGWSMAPTMPAELVCRALRMAIASRQPAPGLIMHSDRGSQYASGEYQALLQQHGLICSMSRKGNCWDNAAMERFFLNLKMERVWQRDYANQMEATKDVVDYIVGFYNCLRLHSTLGYTSPINYEQEMAAKQPSDVSEIS
jgi:transposase InsO family protein